MYRTHDCAVKKVIVDLSEEDALHYESELIMYIKYQTSFRLTNVIIGGTIAPEYEPSLESRQKKSIKAKEMWNRDGFRERMIALRHDPDGPYQSSEYKQKISNLVSGSKNPNYQNYWTQQQKEHMSSVRKNNGKSAGANNPRAISIICLETGEVFQTVADAMKCFGVKSHTSFTLALNEPKRTAANLHWSRYDPLLDDEKQRFKMLVKAYAESQKPYMICVQTKQIFKKSQVARMVSTRKLNAALKANKLITIEDKDYMYVTDYVDGRLYE